MLSVPVFFSFSNEKASLAHDHPVLRPASGKAPPIPLTPLPLSCSLLYLPLNGHGLEHKAPLPSHVLLLCGCLSPPHAYGLTRVPVT